MKYKFNTYIGVSEEGNYKIGQSRNVANRVHQISPKISIIALLKSRTYPIALNLERNLHTHFREKWIYGDWFALNPLDIQWIRQAAFYHPTKEGIVLPSFAVCLCHGGGWKKLDYNLNTDHRVPIIKIFKKDAL